MINQINQNSPSTYGATGTGAGAGTTTAGKTAASWFVKIDIVM